MARAICTPQRSDLAGFSLCMVMQADDEEDMYLVL